MTLLKRNIALLLTLVLIFTETVPVFAETGNGGSADADSAWGEDSLQEAQPMPTTIQPTSWMSFLDDNAVITELNLPGSVNSLADGYGQANDKEQLVSIDVQLKERGVRVLEMTGVKEKFTVKYGQTYYTVGEAGKISFMHKNLTTMYPYTKDSSGKYVNPSYTATDDRVVSGINSFLKDNPSEFVVILYRSHEDYFNNGNNETDSVLERWRNLPNVVVYRAGMTVPRVKDVRGKIVLIPQEAYYRKKVIYYLDADEQQKFLTEENAAYRKADGYQAALDSVLTGLKDQDLVTGKTFPSGGNKFDGAGVVIDYKGENKVSNNGMYETFGQSTAAAANAYLRTKLSSVGVYKQIGWILTEFSDWETSKAIIKTNDFSKADCIWWGVSGSTLYLSGTHTDKTPESDVIASVYGNNIPWSAYAGSITEVCVQNEIKPVSMEKWFSGCGKLTTLTGFDRINVTSVTSMADMFNGCSALTSFPSLSWKAGALTGTQRMFYNCTSLKKADLSGWTVTGIKDMENMFGSCCALTQAKLSGWTLDKLTSTTGMFSGCSSINADGIIFQATGNTAALRTVDSMFSGCKKLRNTTMLSGFDLSGVVTVAHMFERCTTLTDICTFVSVFPDSCRDMTSLFSECSALKNADLSGLDVSNVNSFQKLFYKCSALRTVDLTGWEIREGIGDTGLKQMFAEDIVLTTIYTDPDFSFRNAHLRNTSQVTFGNNTMLVNGYGTSYATEPSSQRNLSSYLTVSSLRGELGYLTPKNTCDGLTVTGGTYSYDGEVHTVEAACSKGGTVRYFDSNGNELTTPGYRDPGTYEIWCGDYHGDVLKAIGVATLTINKTSFTNGEFHLTLEDRDSTGYYQDGNLFVLDKNATMQTFGVDVKLTRNGVVIPEENYTLEGTASAGQEGYYEVRVTGKGGYEGTLAACWGILKAESHVTEHNAFTESYDGTDEHYAYAESDLGTVSYSTDGGATWSTSIPKFKDVKTTYPYYYGVDYKVEWNLSGTSLASPSEPHQQTLLGINQITGLLFCILWKKNVTASSPAVLALPGVDFKTPAVTFDGIPAADKSKYEGSEKLKIGGTEYAKDGTVNLSVAGLYAPTLVSGITADKNYIVTEELGQIVVLDVDRSLDDEAFFEVGEEAVLSVYGSALSDAEVLKKMTFQWQKYNGSAWENISGATEYTLKQTMTDELHTKQFRCIVGLKDSAATLTTDSVTVYDIDAITADSLDVTGDASVTYDGGSHTRTVSVKSGLSWLAGAKITYSRSYDGTYSESALSFTDAGDYTVWYRVEKAGFHTFEGILELEIRKAERDASWKLTFTGGSTEKAYSYTGDWYPAADGSEFAYAMDGKITAANSSAYFGTSPDECLNTEIPTQKEASWDYDENKLGKYTFYYRVVSNNYTDVTGSLSYSIAATLIDEKNVRLSPGTVFAYTEGKSHTVTVESDLSPNSYEVITRAADLTQTEKNTYTVYVRGINDYMGYVALKWEIKEGKAIPFTFDDDDHDGTLSAVYDSADPKEYSVHAALDTAEDPAVETKCMVEYMKVSWDVAKEEYSIATSSDAGKYKEPGTHYEIVHVTPRPGVATDYVEDYFLSVIRILDVKATSADVTYDGEAHSINVEVLGNWEIGGDDLTVEYSTDGSTWKEENPGFTDAGSYTVYYRLLDEQRQPMKSGSSTVTIHRKELTGTLSVAGISEYRYDGKAKTVELYLNGEAVDWNEFRLTADSDSLTQTGTGTYTAEIEGTRNYQGKLSATWKIATSTAGIFAKDYYGFYDGAAHSATLVVPEGYTAKYYSSPDFSPASESASPISFTDAGNHISYYRVMAKAGGETVTGTLTVSLAGYSVVSYEADYDGFEHGLDIYLSEDLDGATVFYAAGAEGEFRREPYRYDIGDHKVYYSIVSEKYGIAKGYGTISISKAKVLATDFSLSPRSSFANDGEEHEVKVLYKGLPVSEEECVVSGCLSASKTGEYLVKVLCANGHFEIVDHAGNHLSQAELSWKIVAGSLPEVKVTDTDVVYDGNWHSAKAEITGSSAGLTMKYFEYDEVTGEKRYSTSTSQEWNKEGTGDEPFSYQFPGRYVSYYEVSRGTEVLLTGTMSVLIREAEITVKPAESKKLKDTSDPEYTYEIVEEGYEGVYLKGLSYFRESGETPGVYRLSVTVEDEYTNWNYKLNFETSTLTILDVSWKQLKGQRVRPGDSATFEITGSSADLSECTFVWQMKKPGEVAWRNIDLSNLTHRITLSNVTEDMDGTLIRCRIAVADCSAADTNTAEVRLSVGYEEEEEEEETKVYPEGWGMREDGFWYLVRNGKEVKNDWAYNDAGNGVEGWFRFDRLGRMLTGWFLDEKNDWYYLNPVSDGTKGMMLTGLVTATNGKQYYLNPVSDGTKGKMLTGWIKIGKLWYYFDEEKDSATYGALLKTSLTPR